MKLVATAAPIIKALKGCKTVIFDTETSSLFPWRDGKILAGIGIKPLGGESFYLPFRHAGASCPCAQTWKRGPKVENCSKCTHNAFDHKQVGGATWVCPVAWPEVNAPLFELKKLIKALRGKVLIAHNVRYDASTIYQEGFDLSTEKLLCTMVIWRLVSDEEPSYALKKLADKYRGEEHGSASEKALVATMRMLGLPTAKDERRYDKVPAQLILEYMADDLDNPEWLYTHAMPKITKLKLGPLLREEVQVTRALFHMERVGFTIDRTWVTDRKEKIDGLLIEVEAYCRKEASRRVAKLIRQEKKLGATTTDVQEAHKICRDGFDATNTNHIKAIYHAEGTKSWKKTDKGAESWDKDVLTTLAAEGDTLAGPVLRYRALAKIAKTYYGNIEEAITIDLDRSKGPPLNGGGNVLHPNIIQSGTRTGRVSASLVQTLPKQENLAKTWSAEELGTARKTAAAMARVGKKVISHTDDLPSVGDVAELKALSEVRGAFLAREGRGLLLADWSNIEMRILADYAQEEAMLLAFRYGLDIHALAARAAGGLPPDGEDAFKRWRGDGKNLGFGLVYGMGLVLLATKLESTRKEAKGFMGRYFARFPDIKAFKKRVTTTLKRRTKTTCSLHVDFALCPDDCEADNWPRGWLKNKWGRRRNLVDEWGEKKGAFYKGVNVLVQGSAGDLMRSRLWRLQDALVDTGTDILLTVHDEFIIDTPVDMLEKVARITVDAMETCDKFTVPLQVDLEWAPKRWSETIKLKCENCSGLGVTFGMSREELFEALYQDELPDDLEESTCSECNGKRFLFGKALA